MTENARPMAYLAAPLFNPRERDFNVMLTNRLSPLVEVFLPQRDGKLLTKLVAQGHSVEVSQKLIYDNDTAAIDACELVIAILDGRAIDEGVAYELGYGRALGKTCIGFKSDDRAMLPTGDNPMIVCGCHYQVSTVDGLIEQVQTWLVAFMDSKRSLVESKVSSDLCSNSAAKRQ